MVNYLERQFGAHNYISIRNEYFDDIAGQRTGTKTRYTEHLFGWGHWIGTTVLFRPEVRYRAFVRCSGLSERDEEEPVTAAGDVIFFF